MTEITLGTGLPLPLPDSGQPERSVGQSAQFLEQLGFESVWVPDLMLGDGTPTLDAPLVLAAAAAATTRVTIGFSVLVVPIRPAPWLAAQIATLQHLSGDRLALGVGSGGFPDAPFWKAVGVPREGRGASTDTTLALLPRLLSGEPVELAPGTPPLIQAPPATMPPVLVGGSERSFDRVLRNGGWFPSLISPASLAQAVGRLRSRAAEAGAGTIGVTVGGHAILGEDSGARTAFDALVRNLIDVHGMDREDALQAPMRARTPAELAEVIADYGEAGADRVVTGPDNGDWEHQMEFMATARQLLSTH